MIKDHGIEKKQTEYWYGFDMLKGVLIILVFLGHIIPGSIKDTFPRYIIYSFHMPLFIGISGFLLNIEKTDSRFGSLLAKYWKRVGLPWCIAIIVFFIVEKVVFEGSISITCTDIVKAFLHPSYHLWYILGFVSYVLLSWLLWKIFRKHKYKWFWIIFIAGVISFISKSDLLNRIIDAEYISLILEYVRYDFRLYYYIYFILGIYCRYKYEHTKVILMDRMIRSARIMMILLVVARIVLFFVDCQNVNRILVYIMNVCILFVVFHDCVKANLPRSAILEFMGEYSLPIYLYHVLSKRLGQFLFSIGSIEYYAVGILTFIVGCVLVYYLRRVSFIDKVIFGATKGISRKS